MTVVYILVAILILMFMITIHELGHYLAGKMLGFKINEFAIGFGKAIFKRTSKKTGEVFSIRLIPLGGYCAFDGDEADSFDGKTEVNNKVVGSDGKEYTPFNKMHPWKRLVVLFSGAFANYICAIIFSIVLLASVGYYSNVNVVAVDSDMTHNNLKQGDIIQEINGKKFSIINSWGAQSEKFDLNEEFTLTILRDGQTIQETVTKQKITSSVDNSWYNGVGITYSVEYVQMDFFSALGKSFVFSAELAWMVLSFFGQMITGQVSLGDMGGPFSTISVMTQSVSASMVNILLLVPLISVNLAVFNLLPIPALDGARMVFVAIEWVRKRPVNPALENKIHMIGLFILLGFVLILDINYLFFANFLMSGSMLC